MILFLLEYLGTIAFAISGAMVGIQKKMDVFGVAILGLTTAMGGGVIRDLILGLTPPSAFQNPIFAVTAISVGIILFIPSVRKAFENKTRFYENLILFMDSIGLGLFTVAGVQIAHLNVTDNNLFLITFVGVITGVGGGILRDIFAGDKPYIFVKHFYASASIIGAWCCALLWKYIGETQAMIVGALLTVILRLLAAHYRWELPKAD